MNESDMQVMAQLSDAIIVFSDDRIFQIKDHEVQELYVDTP